jgi:Mce-associated membrane protein
MTTQRTDRRPTVPEERQRTLRLVRGEGSPTPARRRTVRRPPATRDIEDLLRHLDEEPSGPSRSVRRRTSLRRPPAPPVRRSRRPQWTSVGLAVLVVAALAVAGFTGYRWYRDGQVDRAHQQALAAAKQTTVNFISVSAASIDRDLQRVQDGATGDFKDEFTRDKDQVHTAVTENNVDSKGTVLQAALVSGDTRHAVVLVAIDATVKNTKTPDGRVSHYRIQVDLTRDAGTGRWLVSRLQFVG